MSERPLLHWDVSQEQLMELLRWLEPWLARRVGGGAAGGAGDYVYLGSASVAEDDNPLVFPDIDSLTAAKGGGFTHLVMEATVFQDTGTVGDPLQTLEITWGGAGEDPLTDGYVSGVMRYYSTDNPTAAEGLFDTDTVYGFPRRAVFVPNFIIPTRASATSLTLRFPRYRDSTFKHTVRVDGESFNDTPDDGILRAIVRGGGANLASSGDIGMIQLASGDQFHSLSRADLYGIRGS